MTRNEYRVAMNGGFLSHKSRTDAHSVTLLDVMGTPRTIVNPGNFKNLDFTQIIANLEQCVLATSLNYDDMIKYCYEPSIESLYYKHTNYYS